MRYYFMGKIIATQLFIIYYIVVQYGVASTWNRSLCILLYVNQDQRQWTLCIYKMIATINTLFLCIYLEKNCQNLIY